VTIYEGHGKKSNFLMIIIPNHNGQDQNDSEQVRTQFVSHLNGMPEHSLGGASSEV
jgi:hypothetical protein